MKIGPFTVVASADVPPSEVWIATPAPLLVEVDGPRLRITRVLRIDGKIVNLETAK